MRHPRKPDPEVMESDYRVPTALGTAAWTAALIVLVAMGDALADQDRWWRWVCLTGMALGAFGLLYIPRHLRKSPDTDERRAAEATGAIAPRDTRREQAADTEPELRDVERDGGPEPAADAPNTRTSDEDAGGDRR